MQINELNDKYYVLYGELYEAKAVLPVKQYETMCKALYEQYCRELLAEILSRANVSESEPEAGEYGAGSAEAQNGFAEPGAAEEDIQFYAAIEEAV